MVSAVIVRAGDEPRPQLQPPKPPSPPNILSSSLIILILAIAVSVTVYGLARFDWANMRTWPVEERTIILIALAPPALLMLAGSFWRYWSRLAAAVVFGAAIVTFGPAVLGVIAFVSLGFIAIGQVVFRIRLNTVEDGLLALAMGFGLTGLVIGFTLPIRIHFDFVYAGLFLVAMYLARQPLWLWLKSCSVRILTPLQQPMAQRIFTNAGIACALIVAIGLMLYATAMENGPDALTTHFAFVERLREFGFMPLDPDATPAVFMPKATIWGLASVDVIGGEFALRAAHAALLGAAAALIAMRSARWMGAGVAGLLAATLLAAPVALWITAQFFEETGAILFVTAAAIFFLRGEGGEKPHHEDWWAFAAFGLAVSAKMQVLFLGIMGVALVLRRLQQAGIVQGLRVAAIGCVIFFVMGSGFYIRAALMTGNPLFPIVPGETVDARWSHPLSVTTPYEMVFQTGYMEAYAGGFAFQFILLLGAGLAVLFVPRGRSIRWFGIIALIFAVALASQTPYARYQLYAFPLLMLSLAALFPLITSVGRVFVAVALAALVFFNLGFWRSVHVAPFTLAQLASPQLSSYVAPERRAFDALDALYGRNTVVYVAGGTPVSAGLSGTVHTISRTAKALQAAPTINEVGRILRDAGVTHIVLAGPPRNQKVVDACELVCREFPLQGSLGLRIFEVDLSLAGMLADRIDLPELLGRPPPAEAIPTSGWSAREEWGWWSTASMAEVKLSGFAGASQLNVRFQVFAPPGTDGLDVDVKLDGVSVAKWRFEAGPIGTLDKRQIQLTKPIAASDPGVLTFDFSRTYSPKATTGGEDQRQLAVGLIGIER